MKPRYINMQIFAKSYDIYSLSVLWNTIIHCIKNFGRNHIITSIIQVGQYRFQCATTIVNRKTLNIL